MGGKRNDCVLRGGDPSRDGAVDFDFSDGGGVGRSGLELKEKNSAVADPGWDEEEAEGEGFSVDIVKPLEGGGGGAGVAGPVEANGDPKNAAVLLLELAGVGASAVGAPPPADANASFGEGSGDGRPKWCVSMEL